MRRTGLFLPHCINTGAVLTLDNNDFYPAVI